jgi:nitroreductase
MEEERLNIEPIESKEVMTGLSDLMFYKTGAMSFHRKSIPKEAIIEILRAATSCAWFGKWKMLSVTERSKRVRLVEAWQESLKRIGRMKDVEFIERWKNAPLFVAFCQPKALPDFGWVPAHYAWIYSIQEIGAAVRSLELKALEYGVGLHGIMGLLNPEVGKGVMSVLGIPGDQELVYFGILGYPDKTSELKFPRLADVCYFGSWGARQDVESR